mmetsp:Transcript_121198/g.348218  ORF Transcript_121198/g.348218 Transcript_121198/m.348218 type:complete len:248 (-) Transcript_121198:368-1111(-)
MKSETACRYVSIAWERSSARRCSSTFMNFLLKSSLLERFVMSCNFFNRCIKLATTVASGSSLCASMPSVTWKSAKSWALWMPSCAAVISTSCAKVLDCGTRTRRTLESMSATWKGTRSSPRPASEDAEMFKSATHCLIASAASWFPRLRRIAPSRKTCTNSKSAALGQTCWQRVCSSFQPWTSDLVEGLPVSCFIAWTYTSSAKDWSCLARFTISSIRPARWISGTGLSYIQPSMFENIVMHWPSRP